MGDKSETVDWIDVKSWLESQGRTVKIVQKFGDSQFGVYEVTRGLGPWKRVCEIKTFSMEIKRLDGVIVRFLDRVPVVSVARAAAALGIKDARGVLGSNWEERFPEEKKEADASAKEDERRESMSKPSDGPPEEPERENKDKGQEREAKHEASGHGKRML